MRDFFHLDETTGVFEVRYQNPENRLDRDESIPSDNIIGNFFATNNGMHIILYDIQLVLLNFVSYFS